MRQRKTSISGIVSGNQNRRNLLPDFLKFPRFIPIINRLEANIKPTSHKKTVKLATNSVQIYIGTMIFKVPFFSPQYSK